MKMKSITGLTEAEHKKYVDMHNNLKGKLINCGIMFDEFERRSGRSYYSFNGTISNELIEKLGRIPTEEEIVILVDGGFSHFGANCDCNGLRFGGTVYID
jgi:hypothetical protein